MEVVPEKVSLYVYDISQGMAKAMSMALIGQQLDGIWHTGVVAYGYEYFYGGGIQATFPGGSPAGSPLQVIELGTTQIPQADFHAFLQDISSKFTPDTYSLLKNNCNHFANECAKFLTGNPIPYHIVGLPEIALSTPMGQNFRPFIENMERNMQGPGGPVPWATGRLVLPTPQPPKMRKKSERKEQTIASAAATPVTSVPTATSGTTALKFIGTSKTSQPMASEDTKHKLFIRLIKINSKKPETKLDSEEFASIQAASDLLDSLSLPLTKTAPTTTVPSATLALLQRILGQWTGKPLFPVLGLVRLLLLLPSVSAHYEAEFRKEWSVGVPAESLLNRLIGIASTPTSKAVPVAARLMALCSLANLFISNSMAQFLAQREMDALERSDVATLTKLGQQVLKDADPTLRMMAATVLFNLSLYLPKTEENEVGLELVEALSCALAAEKDAMAALRQLLALGTLAYDNTAITVLLAAQEFNLDAVQGRFSGSDQTVQDIQSASNDISFMLAKMMEDLE